MNILNLFLNKLLALFEKEPQKIGLSQLKPEVVESIPQGPSIRKKDVKLSDLMRRAG